MFFFVWWVAGAATLIAGTIAGLVAPSRSWETFAFALIPPSAVAAGWSIYTAVQPTEAFGFAPALASLLLFCAFALPYALCSGFAHVRRPRES
jgi:hypothetical protein